MSDKKVIDMSQKELLALPWVGWGDENRNRWWDSLIILPTRQKHDSGWLHIAIIGCDNDSSEGMLLAMPDDITWPEITPRYPDMNGMSLRTDASPKNHALRLWSNYYKFRVDAPLSSVTIEVKAK
jgi:hypothetical protein